MSGNRTYIGPFGRILPLPEDHDAEPEGFLGPVDETRSSSAMYTLPRPALDFGSDSRGFTDPLRYSSQRNAPPPTRWDVNNVSSGDQARAVSHDLLPGVRQLLEPAVHVQPVTTPTTAIPQQRPPEPSSSLSGRSGISEPATHAISRTYSSNYHSSRSPEIPQPFRHFTTQDHRLTDSLPPFSEPPIQRNMHNTTPILATFPLYSGQAAHNLYNPRQNPQAGPPIGYSQPPRLLDDTPSAFPSVQPGFYHTSSVIHQQDESTNFQGSLENRGDPKQSERNSENPVKPHPRVVHETILPGEGPVWVYEDGSTCPKVIDGEPVNAAWGITKAGKPRKRLAIACTTCREKKIKCQPALPKCAQCDKFGRDCHYATAPRTQHIVSETSSHEFQAQYKPIKIKTETQPYKVLLPLITAASKDDDNHMVKRRKSSPEQEVSVVNPECGLQIRSRKALCKNQRFSILSADLEGEKQLTSIKKQSEEVSALTEKTSWEEHLRRVQFIKYDLGTNPYHIDQQATKHYAEMFVVHGNAAAQYLFPRKAIPRWLESRPHGSRDDMMLIYSILALGSVFSGRQNCKSDGELFSDIARYAIEESQSHYSLQLVQSRLLLGLYYFARGDSPSGWDISGQGLQAALSLKLNIEEHCRNISEDKDDQLGLRRHALVECRRRTYWLAYIIDRLGDFDEEHVPMLQSQDTFLRLPCTEIVYALQGPSSAQYFRNDSQLENAHQLYQSSGIGSLAYLVEISAIWGDVSTYIYRHSREPVDVDEMRYKEYNNKVMRRLYVWKTSLHKDLVYTSSNVSLAIEKGIIGIFLEIHTLYHATIMRLHRNLSYNTVPPLSRSRNFIKAREQAHHLLEMMEIITSASRSSKNALDTSGSFPDFSDEGLESCSALAGSTSFAGYAILLAIDILSAGGPTDPKSLTPLIQSMSTGLAVVDELSQCWASAVTQKKIILQRLESLSKINTRAAAGTRKFWRCRKALDTGFKSGHDSFYAGADGDFASDGLCHEMGATVNEQDVVFLD